MTTNPETTEAIVQSLPAWVDAKRIAGDTCTTVNTIRTWLAQGRMPPPDIRGHRFNRWKRETIAPFLADPSGWLEKKGA